MERLSGSLIHWLKTFNIEGITGYVEDFSDGVVISKVLNNIDAEFFDEAWLAKIKRDAGSNWRLKASNLKKILKGILDYYNEVLGQQITGFCMPDVNALAEKNDEKELGRLLQLILGCAVNCERKHEYIEALMGLEEDIQHDVMNAIQELMMKEIPTSYQSETYADLNNQLKGLTEDLHSTKESKEQITQRCHELDMQVAVLLEEKNSLISENEKLQKRLNHIESFEDPSTLAGKRFQQMQQKLELLQDELFKIETGRDELKAKVENQQKEIIDLQQKNDELQRLAEESQAMKDELDFLRHTSDKVNVYEATIESYKKKLEDMSDLKRQVKLLESKNTHYMQQSMELEEELKKIIMMKSQIDMYEKQVQELQSRLSEETKRADNADFENKRALEKLASIQQEKDRLVIERDSLKESLEELRCMQIQNEKNSSEGRGNDTSMGDSELLDAVPPEIRYKKDDERSRINELETDNRLANRRILELESQIEDLHANQSAASVQEDTDLKQKLNSAIKRQKEADAEIQNYSVTIESLESQIEVSDVQTVQEKGNQTFINENLKNLESRTEDEEYVQTLQVKRKQPCINENLKNLESEKEDEESYQVLRPVKRTYIITKKKRKEKGKAENDELAVQLEEIKQKLLLEREMKKRVRSIEKNINDNTNPLNSRVPQLLELFQDSGSGITLSKEMIRVSKASLATLIDERWLNDEVIDAYNSYLSIFRFGRRKDFMILTTLFIESIRRHVMLDGIVNLKRILLPKNTTIFDKEYVLFPVNTGVHWCLVVAHNLKNLPFITDKSDDIPDFIKNDWCAQQPKLLIYDSIKGRVKTGSFLLAFQRYLQLSYEDKYKKELNLKNLKIIHVDIPCQKNIFDCGVHVLHNIEIILSVIDNKLRDFDDAILNDFHRLYEIIPIKDKRYRILKTFYNLMRNEILH